MHQKLVRGRHEDVLRDLGSYIDALERHFLAEEKLLANPQDGMDAVHIGEHRRLIVTLQAHAENYVTQSVGEWGRRLMDCIDEIERHILTYDRLLS
ncbi:MAG: hypothetical protein HQL36_09905, partial [Alphaproteobacteria bacterium]|nr:hypothetical protein [Alphaproteobacteria bacterium]